MEYGYARVSSKEQKLEQQIQALLEAGVERKNIFCDKEYENNFNLKEYNLLMGTEISAPLLRAGDLLVICNIDQLGCNYMEITKEWQRITKGIGVDIRVLNMSLLDTRNFDTGSDRRFVADLALQIFSYVAEREQIHINNRHSLEIEISTGNGVHPGRPRAEFPDNWNDIYPIWKAKKITAREAMRQLGLKNNTFYNLVKRYEQS